MDSVMKKVKSLLDNVLLIKGATTIIENKTKEQRHNFFLCY